MEMFEQQYTTTRMRQKMRVGGGGVYQDSRFQSTRYSKPYENAVTNILWIRACQPGLGLMGVSRLLLMRMRDEKHTVLICYKFTRERSRQPLLYSSWTLMEAKFKAWQKQIWRLVMFPSHTHNANYKQHVWGSVHIAT